MLEPSSTAVLVAVATHAGELKRAHSRAQHVRANPTHARACFAVAYFADPVDARSPASASPHATDVPGHHSLRHRRSRRRRLLVRMSPATLEMAPSARNPTDARAAPPQKRARRHLNAGRPTWRPRGLPCVADGWAQWVQLTC
jgi:hypothetical protein